MVQNEEGSKLNKLGKPQSDTFVLLLFSDGTPRVAYSHACSIHGGCGGSEGCNFVCHTTDDWRGGHYYAMQLREGSPLRSMSTQLKSFVADSTLTNTYPYV